MKKAIILLVLVFLVSMQLFLPAYIAQQLEKDLKEEVDSYQSLKVEINSFPALKLLLRSADKLKLKGQAIVVDGLKLDYLTANFKDLKLKKIDDQWQTVRGENTKLMIVITEEDLNNYLKSKEDFNIFKKINLNLTPKQVILTGVISLFSAEVNLQLTGNFKVVNNQELVFSSEKLAVENFLVATSSIQQLKDKLQFKLDLEELSLPLKVTKVNLKNDQLEIVGPKWQNN